jgi:hypothetical protein
MFKLKRSDGSKLGDPTATRLAELSGKHWHSCFLVPRFTW